MLSTNIFMLQTVANGLGELKDEMVFVGGAVAELYANNPPASEIRPTLDVDCVIEIKITKTLPDETEIFVFPLEYYLAAKFKAHKGRGGNNLRQSHDFEDIIYILDNCPDLLDDIRNANPTVKSYLKEE